MLTVSLHAGCFVFRISIPDRGTDSYCGTGSAGEPHPFRIPARLLGSAGCVKSFENRFPAGGTGDPAQVRRTSLGIRTARSDQGEKAGAINGVILGYQNSAEELAEGSIWMELVPRPASDFETCSWQALPSSVETVWVQLTIPKFMVGCGTQYSAPVLQSFIDMQMLDFMEYGTDFVKEYLECARGWPKCWLNDREIARRPWIHLPKYKVIDELLANYPAAPFNTYEHRSLNVEFSAKAALASLKAAELDVDKAVAELDASFTAGTQDADAAAAGEAVPVTYKQPRDWTGRKLPSANAADFVFGFGSLINTKSRMASDPQATDAVPVRVVGDFGYCRAWNFQSSSARLTALGLEKLPAGESRTINGIISPVFGAEGMAALDEREAGYCRVQIPVECIEATSWIALPEGIADGGKAVWVYIPMVDGQSGPGVGLSMASYKYPILQTYIDVCLLGCLECGTNCAYEFIESTRGWEGPWLDDRQTPRRPWIHQSNYNQIDQILERAIPEHFKNRMLPEDMGAAMAMRKLNKYIDKCHIIAEADEKPTLVDDDRSTINY